jgi:hypothetical protein
MGVVYSDNQLVVTGSDVLFEDLVRSLAETAKRRFQEKGA